MRWLVMLVAGECFGCSFAFVSGPPSETAAQTSEATPRCTTSVLVPVLDGVAAAVGALNIGIAADASPGTVSWYGVEMDAKTGVTLGVLQLGAFGAGAIYGFVQTARCKAFLAEVRETPAGPTWSPAVSEDPSPVPTAVAPVAPAVAPVVSATSDQTASPGATRTPPAPTTSAPPAATASPPPEPSAPKVPTVSFPD
jgi:hypothetical protein